MAPRPETNRRFPVLLWVAALVALVVIVLAIRSLTREPVAVRVAQAGYGDVVRNEPTNGRVEPIEDFQAHAQSPGVVEEIYVEVGDRVKAGQMLLRMDDLDAKARLASMQSTLQAAELANNDIQHGGSQDERNTFAGDLSRAQLQQQQDAASLASLQQLQQKGAAAPAEVASAQARVNADESNLHGIQQHSTQRYGDADRARAQAQLADARAAVAAAERSLAAADIRSQISGTVYSIPYSQYDYAPAGEELIDVGDLKHLQVIAYFDEPEIGALAVGQPVKIVWDAKPKSVWHGHITQVPSTIIPYQSTRNVGECYISIDDAREGDLPPSTNVTVTVTTAQHLHVLSIPHEALHTESGQNFVFRVIKDKLVRTPVQVDLMDPNHVQITSGLAEGDVVALAAATNSHDLTNGLEVKPVQ